MSVAKTKVPFLSPSKRCWQKMERSINVSFQVLRASKVLNYDPFLNREKEKASQDLHQHPASIRWHRELCHCRCQVCISEIIWFENVNLDVTDFDLEASLSSKAELDKSLFAGIATKVAVFPGMNATTTNHFKQSGLTKTQGSWLQLSIYLQKTRWLVPREQCDLISTVVTSFPVWLPKLCSVRMVLSGE